MIPEHREGGDGEGEGQENLITSRGRFLRAKKMMLRVSHSAPSMAITEESDGSQRSYAEDGWIIKIDDD